MGSRLCISVLSLISITILTFITLDVNVEEIIFIPRRSVNNNYTNSTDTLETRTLGNNCTNSSDTSERRILLNNNTNLSNNSSIGIINDNYTLESEIFSSTHKNATNYPENRLFNNYANSMNVSETSLFSINHGNIPKASKKENYLKNHKNSTENPIFDAQRESTDAYESYCAPSEDVWPCGCWGSTSYVEFHCYGVIDRNTLDKVLSAPFPIRDMDTLKLWYCQIGNITQDFLHTRSYTDIGLMSSNVSYLDLNAFWSSRERLTRLGLPKNSLTTFNFKQLVHFEKLTDLLLGNNKIKDINNLRDLDPPHLALQYFYVNDNELTSIDADIFYSVPHLKILELSSNYLSSLPQNVFMPLSNLTELYLNDNNLVHLQTGTLWFSSPDLLHVYIRHNGLKEVEQDVFKGVVTSPGVDLDHNDLEYFTFDMFGHLLQNISLEYGWISMMKNPLICDCDLLWVLINNSLLQRVYATCTNKTSIHELDVNYYIEECGSGP